MKPASFNYNRASIQRRVVTTVFSVCPLAVSTNTFGQMCSLKKQAVWQWKDVKAEFLVSNFHPDPVCDGVSNCSKLCDNCVTATALILSDYKGLEKFPFWYTKRGYCLPLFFLHAWQWLMWVWLNRTFYTGTYFKWESGGE